MERAFERAKNMATDRITGEDELVSFFMHAWHLKDHVEHDSTLSASIRKLVVSAAHASRILKVCQDVANGLKHFRTKPSTLTGGRTIVAVAGGSVTYYLMISMDDGTERRGLELAGEICGAWRDIFVRVGLSIPT
jgi:hypothetical protein